jgi:hypothetical protein
MWCGFSRPFLQRLAKGRDRFVQPRRLVPPLAERPERVTEIVLRRRPSSLIRNAGAGHFSIMAFLVPLVATAVVYLFSHDGSSVIEMQSVQRSFSHNAWSQKPGQVMLLRRCA